MPLRVLLSRGRCIAVYKNCPSPDPALWLSCCSCELVWRILLLVFSVTAAVFCTSASRWPSSKTFLSRRNSSACPPCLNCFTQMDAKWCNRRPCSHLQDPHSKGYLFHAGLISVRHLDIVFSVCLTLEEIWEPSRFYSQTFPFLSGLI